MQPARAPALIVTIRERQYGLLQDGSATLLPWLQRYSMPGPVPGVPAWMLGLLNVHGTVQAIVDLPAFLGFGESTPDNGTRLIFIERAETVVGLLVDGAAGVRYLDDVDDDGHDEGAPLVAGSAVVNGGPVRILDGGALIDALTRALETPTTRRT